METVRSPKRRAELVLRGVKPMKTSLIDEGSLCVSIALEVPFPMSSTCELRVRKM
jgi:hypothetical protein